MTTSPIAMNEQQLEQLIEEITRQIFCYLGDRQLCELRGLEIDEVVCPGCDQRCVETCPIKARQVMAAGAARLSAGLARAYAGQRLERHDVGGLRPRSS